MKMKLHAEVIFIPCERLPTYTRFETEAQDNIVSLFGFLTGHTFCPGALDPKRLTEV